MDASYIPIAEARGFTTHWISKISTHRVEILQYLNYFLNLYFPFPWPDTGSIISASRHHREEESFGKHGYTKQEFEGEELVDVEEDEEDDDDFIDFEESYDDEDNE